MRQTIDWIVEKQLFTYSWNGHQQQIPDNKLIKIDAISNFLWQH
jgi:hypothetical protein